MTSSSRTPRAVPMAAHDSANATRWTPDELPRHVPPPDVPGGAPAAEAVGTPAPAWAAIEEARDRGFEEGYRSAELALRAQIESALCALRAAACAVHEDSERWGTNLEENICSLAVAVARSVIGREVGADPDIVLATVRKAIAEFPVHADLRVRLHPDDLAFITAAAADTEAHALASQTRLTWIADGNIVSGGCLVEGTDRIVDGRVDAALERIWRRVVDADA